MRLYLHNLILVVELSKAVKISRKFKGQLAQVLVSSKPIRNLFNLLNFGNCFLGNKLIY
jgi:hypothetical protein